MLNVFILKGLNMKKIIFIPILLSLLTVTGCFNDDILENNNSTSEKQEDTVDFENTTSKNKEDNTSESENSTSTETVKDTKYKDSFILNLSKDEIVNSYRELQPEDAIIEVEKGQNGAGGYVMIHFENMDYLMTHLDDDPSYTLASTLPETDENLSLFYQRLHYLIRAMFNCTDSLADEVINTVRTGNTYKTKDATPYNFKFYYRADHSWRGKDCPSVVNAYVLQSWEKDN